MTVNDIYSRLQEKKFREASSALLQWWQELRWEIRFATVGAIVFLLLAWVFSSAGLLPGLLALPFGVGALVAAARPTPFPGRVDRFVKWADNRRQWSLAKGTFFSKWVSRPFYASLSGSARLTAPLKDPYLRAGATIALQSYSVYLALLVTYMAVYTVLILACIAFTLWLLAYLLTGQGGSSTAGRAVSWSLSRRSETREDILGNQYVQHYDDDYNPAGYTEAREDILGQLYQQHFSQEGDRTGHSEEREGIFGAPYTQHFDERGEQSGHSEPREGILGNQYVQHYDESGNPIGRSEEREDFLGNKYIKREDE